MSARPARWLLGGRHYSEVASLALAAPFLILAFVAFILPLGSLLHESLFLPAPTLAHYERAVTEPVYLRVMLRTLRIAASVTVLTLLLAWPLAWLMARSSGLKLAILVASVLLPLWTSVLVRTYAWMVLLQKNGVINQLLMGAGITSEPLRLLYTEGAVVLAMSHVLLPFMVLPIFSALRGIPDDYSRAAQMLGASEWATFREVIFPLSLPGVTSGCLMVFLLALGFFVTPALIGGPQQMMIATLVSQQVREMLDWSFAGALVGVLLAFVLLIAILFKRAVRLDRFVGSA
ncbi:MULTISPECIES: ABC transporter permease [unclassified Bosea (in: a-proteobacteria)]|uniref:ABC transporter permease n=1 Tax=unclassified Bosea (in: a-proteobacteria) TaxID=2653178 RepID=UPI000956B6D5|nr:MULTISPECIES: ABC transporter permease [unclassified Bosea (in: a-proteobacteria)]TAJ34046.1 MAG: ABC transporter permease [Bosea sp. (in: a-proteobacteria)]SIP88892.1 mannopine transport system permease protein [Bosea sp. TND4EK4]